MTIGLARMLSSVWRIATAATVLAGAIAYASCSRLAAQEVTAPTPIWVDRAGRPAHQAHDALAVLNAAASDGLDPADYDTARLQAMATRLQTGGVPAPNDVSEFGATLSASMLRFLLHVSRGRVNPRALGLRLDVPSDRDDMVASLHRAIENDRVAALVAAVSPPHPQYQALKAMLARYRSLASGPAPAPLPTPSIPLRSGDRYPDAGALRRRLVALGDVPPDSSPLSDDAVYGGTLVDGVKAFQIRHGLEPDGIIGKATWSALSVPLAWRVRQIELALERLRWLPDFRGERVVTLDIPMFRVTAWDSFAPNVGPAVEMRAIVGRAVHTPTPVMINAFDAAIFRPYWNIPRSILLHEILPALAKDPQMFEREDMEIVRGEGDDARPVAVTEESLALLRTGALRLRQRPGSKNALGLLKFVLPNDEHVYFHDTPAKQLFYRSRRDFSHGCVRVQDPVGLAEWAFKDDPLWTRDKILAAMSDAEHVSRRIPLKRPVRVVLLYTTAQVRPDGTIHFADDIYGQDGRLDQALRTLHGR